MAKCPSCNYEFTFLDFWMNWKQRCKKCNIKLFPDKRVVILVLMASIFLPIFFYLVTKFITNIQTQDILLYILLMAQVLMLLFILTSHKWSSYTVKS